MVIKMANDIIEKISNTIKPIAKKYNLTNVWLFGSYAKRIQGIDSDIDILVKTEDVADGFKIAEVKFAFEDALKKRVDIVTTESIKDSLLEDANLRETLIYSHE